MELSLIKKQLFTAQRECCSRGLLQSSKWLAELLFALEEVSCEPMDEGWETKGLEAEHERYLLAKNYFDLREYDRAAFFTTFAKSDKLYFLHIYSRYMAGEKRKNDDRIETLVSVPETSNHYLRELRCELEKRHTADTLDGFCLYLYGVVLRKLDLTLDAVNILQEAIQKEPAHWGAWVELATLITDKDMLSSITLQDHWIRQFFLAHTYLELQMNEEALRLYLDLQENGFKQSTYIMAQIAICLQNLQEVDQAVEAFVQLQKVDLYRLDNMDTYSNLLYVKDMRIELSHLAHHVCEIDKYRVETCCVIGNYYSLRSQHEKAGLCFQRALKLNPNYLSAWTLMGHEFMEMKNTQAAIQAYRHAIEVNRKDYRAWYGLGQTYEILKMPFYCLYYYREAQKLRPSDSRMLVALGESYEKLERPRLQEAKKCYWKAYSVGDLEGLALIKLARLYEKLAEDDHACAAYAEYISEAEALGITDREEQSQAYKYLANYHVRSKQYDEAYTYAQKCTDYPETREEGKALLREIAQRRTTCEPFSGASDLPTPVTDARPAVSESTPLSRLSPINLRLTFTKELY
ncbi:PREDICTED: cell division cycle protein 23 homolog [Priapulus caudatus]|uniref:Cell division cycle protein 23 homolog n=1 Tax=Priapulus caudatus TaxID=37621 RepID=A0ABM1ET36_PRICU|nr:PREDICTED: cell division cycle protein 23 homolog [Priapulus caudatus]